MSLKILFIPISFIMLLVLVIGYMKPGFDELMAKRSVYRGFENQLSQMNARLNNIKSVSDDFSSRTSESLGGKNEDEALIDTYLPEAIDQERIVDAFNYLATQSGALVTSIVIDKPVQSAAVTQEMDVNSQSILLNGAGTATVASAPSDIATLQPNYPSPKSFQATLSVKGDYAALSNFLNLIYRMNRENEVKSFTLKKDIEKQDEKGNVVSSSVLNGTFIIAFLYYPGLNATSIQNIEALKVFSTGKLDTQAFGYIQDRTQSRGLPELSVPGFASRANPFVQ